MREPKYILPFVMTGGALVVLFASAYLLLETHRHKNSPSGSPKTITIAISTALNPTLVKIADAKGFFREEGLDTSLLIHTSGKAALQSLLGGKADFATVAETPLMFAMMNGERLTILTTIQTATRNNAIVARKDKGITSPADLKGRRVGVTLGTTADYFLDSYMVVHGMARNQVELVDLRPEEMRDALVQGKVDAVSTWNPYVANLRKTLGERSMTFHDESIYTETFNVVAAREFPEQNTETVLRLLRALVKAETFVEANPDESQAIVSEFSGIDKELLMGIWGDFQFTLSLNQSLLFTLEEQARWAVRAELAPRRETPDFLGSLYVEGLQLVRPESVRIIR